MTHPPSFYEIDLKQGDLLIQLISDDASFISRQMARWFELLVDERTAPVPIRPGLPFLKPPTPPAPPATEIQPVAVMAAPPSVPTPVADDSQTQLLMAQIQLLQSQVQQLTQQVTQPAQPVLAEPVLPSAPPEPVLEPEIEPAPVLPSPTPEPIVDTPPILETLPQSQPEPFPVTSMPDMAAEIPASEPQTCSTPQETDLDAFSTPAHADFNADFGALGSTTNPVDNPPQPVDNLPHEEPSSLAQTSTSEGLPPISELDATPVENPTPAVAEMDDFDALLSSVLTDINTDEAPAEPSGPAPSFGVAGSLFDSPETSIPETPSAEPLPSEPVTPTAANASAFGVAGALFDSPEEPSLESALESAFQAPAESAPVAPSPPVSGMAGALFDAPEETPFESALESALAQVDPPLTADAPVSPSGPINIPLSGMAGALFDEPEPADVDSEPMLALSGLENSALGLPSTPEGPIYTPPNVNYDFGIPLPEPPVDPKIRQLNLDSLQVAPPEGALFDSPFPQVDLDAEPAPVVHEAFSLDQPAELGGLQVETFQDLCDLAPQAASGHDFLILSAFFLSQVQQSEKYALKDLNAHLMRAGLTPVNHSVLEQVMGQGLLQLVPDLTGTASTAEYRLTEQGEARANALIQS